MNIAYTPTMNIAYTPTMNIAYAPKRSVKWPLSAVEQYLFNGEQPEGKQHSKGEKL
jgi:hypothetical protein